MYAIFDLFMSLPKKLTKLQISCLICLKISNKLFPAVQENLAQGLKSNALTNHNFCNKMIMSTDHKFSWR